MDTYIEALYLVLILTEEYGINLGSFFFVLETDDSSLFVTGNRCTPIKIYLTSAVGFCACQII